MARELVTIEQRPIVPDDWNFDESVARVRPMVYKWKNLTLELADELWIAREALSHHGLPQDGRRTWDEYCEAIESSRQVVDRWLAAWFGTKVPKLPSSPSPIPSGLFATIVADPPWPYGTQYDPDTRRVASPYPEMPLEDIASLQIPAADNCILWLWTTNAFMREAYDVLAAWGFEAKTILTWVKDRMVTGYWLRGQTEHCILATRGSPTVNLTNETTALHAPLRQHSRKPDEFYTLVEGLCPGPFLELFARTERPNWQVHGNEVGLFQG